MHQRTHCGAPGSPLQLGTNYLRTGHTPTSTLSSAPTRLPWSSGSGGRSSCCLCPRAAAPLWVWLLLTALLVPGAHSFLREEEEELLVELHNHYRGLVSPTASAMLPLKWDPSLKAIAEEYAAKCVWSHNPELVETGENLYAGSGPLDLRVALEKWFMEYVNYDYHNNSCDDDMMCGHYTQMVWADTHRVGCAFHLCNTMEGLEWERVSFLVCNYYPPGNYEGDKPYEEGDWCSRCPENLQNCENNLCVADDEEEEEDMTVLPPAATDELPPELHSTPAPGVPSATSPAPSSASNPAHSPSSPPSNTHVKPTARGEKEEEEREDEVAENELEKGHKGKGAGPKDRRRTTSSSSSVFLYWPLVSLTAIFVLSL